MLEYILKILEEKVVNYENQLYLIIKEIKQNEDIEKNKVYFEKIWLVKLFLDHIYLSFNDELKLIMNQRLWQKEKLIKILSDFDRIDDFDTRKILTQKIKEGYYE